MRGGGLSTADGDGEEAPGTGGGAIAAECQVEAEVGTCTRTPLESQRRPVRQGCRRRLPEEAFRKRLKAILEVPSAN